MEFSLAAQGRTQELRSWLQRHPERINVPSPGSNHTLLYTALVGSKSPDLDSLQAGGDSTKYIETVRMLCEEFKSDLAAPNGGNHNTVVHLAVELGDEVMLAYLIRDRQAPFKRNAFGEDPLAYARRVQPAARVVAMLQTEADRRAGKVAADADGAAGEEGEAITSLRQRLHRLRIQSSDSDSDDGNERKDGKGERPHHAKSQAAAATTADGGGGTSTSGVLLSPSPSASAAVPEPANRLPPRHNTAPRGLSKQTSESQYANLQRDGPQTSTGSFAAGAPRQVPAPSAGVPPPAPSREERDLTELAVLPNAELQQFSNVFGNGFTYFSCRDHYEIRGLLPYRFKGNEYYTPVILSVYAPRPPALSTTGPAANDSSHSYGNSVDSSSSSSSLCYTRYRALIDTQRMNDFAISRKAEYIDPLSGAIIPSASDGVHFRSLVEFVREAVVANFERTAPMITKASAYAFVERPSVSLIGSSSDNFRHHHSSSSPAYMANVLAKRDANRLRVYRILQDLSRFGDGLFHFDLRTRTALGAIPILQEKKSGQGVLVVSTSPNGRGSGSGGGGDAAGFPAGAGGPSNSTSSTTTTVDTEIVFMVRLRIYFPMPGETSDGSGPTVPPPPPASGGACGPAPPPLVYLRDCCDPATQRTPTASLVNRSHSGGSAAMALSRDVSDTHSNAADDLSSSSAGAVLERAYAKANFVCFRGLLADTRSGLIRQNVLEPLTSAWTNVPVLPKAGAAPGTDALARYGPNGPGSLYDLLILLQRRLTVALASFAGSFRSSVGGASNASAASASPLDALFAPPTASTSSLPHPTETATGARCLLCFKRSKNTVLQPCRHVCCCMDCAQRRVNHARGGSFSCPVCHAKVQEVQEIYL